MKRIITLLALLPAVHSYFYSGRHCGWADGLWTGIFPNDGGIQQLIFFDEGVTWSASSCAICATDASKGCYGSGSTECVYGDTLSATFSFVCNDGSASVPAITQDFTFATHGIITSTLPVIEVDVTYVKTSP